MTKDEVTGLIEFTKDFVAEHVAKRTPGKLCVAPMAVFMNREGKTSVCGIEQAFLRNGRTKDALAKRMEQTARSTGAVAFYFVCEVWMQVKPARSEEERRAQLEAARKIDSIAGHPDSREAVMIQEITGGRIVTHTAIIEGTTLGPWRGEGGRCYEGRFIDKLAPVISQNYACYVN